LQYLPGQLLSRQPRQTLAQTTDEGIQIPQVAQDLPFGPAAQLLDVAILLPSLKRFEE